MRMMMKLAGFGLALAIAALAVDNAGAQTRSLPTSATRAVLENAVFEVSPRGPFPRVEKVEVSRGKSLMVQFPFGLRDVLVSDPNRVDAVVQSSNRVFLLAKGIGEVNIFFFNEKGDHVLTLDVEVGAGRSLLSSTNGDERSLNQLNEVLANLLPGAQIRTKRVGQSIVLTGSVPSPAASARATTIAREYARALMGQARAAGAAQGFSRYQAAVDDSSNAGGSAESLPAGGGVEGGNGDARANGAAAARARTTVADDKLVINLLTIEAEEQVMLQVVVAEVQRSIMKQFGINLGAAINSGNFTTSLLTENALPLTAAAGLGRLPLPGIGTGGSGATGCAVAGSLCVFNPGPNGSFGNSGLAGRFGSSTAQVAYAIRMLERDGLIRTLAEPNLTAVSGETAKFLAGGEYPIPVVDATGRQSVSYKEFGIGVAFTPVVLSEGRISLKIETEVSELTDVGGVVLSSISIPALKKREAKSTVELPSGGTLALAGLLSEDTRKNIDGFPGLKDVPVLGTLFRSNDFIKRETELVVLVTPYMVKPVARQKLARPDDGLAPASDHKFNFYGHLNRVYGKDLPTQVGLKDGAGFIID